MNELRIESAEHVLPGHPDKLCDAFVDAVVDLVRRGDEEGQCGLEAAVVFDAVFLTGRVAARDSLLAELDLAAVLRETYRAAGYGEDAAGHLWGPHPDSLQLKTRLCWGDFEPGERELRHLSDDQAICVGYANELVETEHLPPAHWLARRIARRLFALRAERGAGQIGPDGKVLVTVERNGRGWRPLRVSISLNHHEGSDWLLLRRVAEEAVEWAGAGLDLPTPPILLNGAGMFVAGGPNGDNGLSGKKLVLDAYGPTVPIGGGAWSGKDFHKVDRLGGLLARSLAKRAVLAGLGREALVSLDYTPGCSEPAGISARVDGVEFGPDFLGRIGAPALDNQRLWREYAGFESPLVELARWGHQQAGLPWE